MLLLEKQHNLICVSFKKIAECHVAYAIFQNKITESYVRFLITKSKNHMCSYDHKNRTHVSSEKYQNLICVCLYNF